MRLAVSHNLFFYNNMMQEIRDHLEKGTFEAFRQQYSKILDTRI